MKGLLIKDTYMILKYCKPFLFVVFVFSVLSGFVNNLFFYVYPAAFVALIPFTLGAYDERSKWNIYCGTLPVARKTVVSGKYLISLIVAACIIFLTVISMTVAMVVDGSVNINMLFSIISTILLVSLTGTATLLPVYFKFGTEKARIIYMVILALVASISAGLGVGTDYKVPEVKPIPMIIMAIVIYSVSWFVSIKIYEKKEL